MERQEISGESYDNCPVTPDAGRGGDTSAPSGYESLVNVNDEGNCEITLLVDGVHCAACIQKIESRLGRESDVVNARLNFSTHRLVIAWNENNSERANDFVRAVSSLGYDVKPFDAGELQEGSKEEGRFLLTCLGIAGFAMANIMMLSIGVWSSDAVSGIFGSISPDKTGDMDTGTREFIHWLSALIALPTIIFAGRPFFRSALKALSNGHTNMDVPISIAILLAGGMSLHETITHGQYVYFDSVVMLMFFLLIGRYLDHKARSSARSTATDLMSMMTGFASVVENYGQPDEKIKKVLIRNIREKMIVRVSAGENFPADGKIISGSTEVDTSMVTGETIPRKAKKGSDVYAGTLNLSAPVDILVARASEDSLLSDIVRLMEKAGQGQARYVRLADKAASLYAPVVHTMAVLAFLGWFFIGGLPWQEALLIAVTVLIITCPCALGLAVPVVQVLATGKLMKHGILVKSGDALERLATIDTVIMDKTGSLTLGRPELVNPEEYDEEMLTLAAALAAHSSHPLSKAVLKAYKGNIPEVKDISEYSGKGMQGIYNGKIVRLGSARWCGDSGRVGKEKHMELWLHVEGEKPYPFYFSDNLRPDSKEVIREMKKMGIKFILLSGDREEIVRKTAHEAGIDEFYGEKTPVEKFEILESIKAKGHKVLMIGDGLNDTPVLAGASVSASPSSALDMAQNAADIIFMGDSLKPLLQAYRTAKKTNILVLENFAMSIIYNVVAIPLALFGMVTPMIAAIAMSCSSLLVVANSFRLRLGK